MISPIEVETLKMSAVLRRFFNIMALTKEQKEKQVEKILGSITKQKAMVFVSFSGLTAPEIEKLRHDLREAGAQLIVAKKTLAKIAFEKEKLEFPETDNELAIVFAYEDEIAPVKSAHTFSKENEKLNIIGGFMDGQFISGEKMKILAQLPSRNELMARLVNVLSGPISNFVNVQRENLKGLLYVLKAIK